MIPIITFGDLLVTFAWAFIFGMAAGAFCLHKLKGACA